LAYLQASCKQAVNRALSPTPRWHLGQYPIPNLVIEISDTSLGDDLGAKRFQYEGLGIPEYWIVNVQAARILAFAIAPDKSIRHIRESQVLPEEGGMSESPVSLEQG
jgi:Uma2 family endonuclease